MRLPQTMKSSVPVAGLLLTGGLWLGQALRVSAQEPQAKEEAGNDALVRAVGLSPRASAADYQAHAQAGTVTIAADFMGHGVPTADAGPYNTEDYVIVEVGLFGPAAAKLALSYQDFSLRINGKKTPQPGQSYVVVFKSLKDPEWEPPEPPQPKSSKNKVVGGGGGGGEDEYVPPIVHMPIELVRAMQQRVHKASLPEGERPLPQAGLLFFEFHGATKGIHAMDLLYSGPAGKATITLQK